MLTELELRVLVQCLELYMEEQCATWCGYDGDHMDDCAWREILTIKQKVGIELTPDEEESLAG